MLDWPEVAATLALASHQHNLHLGKTLISADSLLKEP